MQAAKLTDIKPVDNSIQEAFLNKVFFDALNVFREVVCETSWDREFCSPSTTNERAWQCVSMLLTSHSGGTWSKTIPKDHNKRVQGHVTGGGSGGIQIANLLEL